MLTVSKELSVCRKNQNFARTIIVTLTIEAKTPKIVITQIA